MKALVKSKSEPGLWLQDVPEPKIGINDVLIKVHRTGICGTDLHIYNWDAWAQKTIPVPMAVGHEFVGEIVEVGSNVTDFFPGNIVSGEGHVVCGRCRNCLAGRRPLCAHTKGVGVNRPGGLEQVGARRVRPYLVQFAKRIRFQSMGRVFRYRKRHSHLTVVLEEKAATPTAAPVAAKEKSKTSAEGAAGDAQVKKSTPKKAKSSAKKSAKKAPAKAAKKSPTKGKQAAPAKKAKKSK